MSKKHTHKPVHAAQPGPQETEAQEQGLVEIQGESIPANAVLAALDSKDLTPDARRRLGAHLRSLLQDGEDVLPPVNRDPKTGAPVYANEGVKPKQFAKRKKPIETAPKVPFRILKRQAAEYQAGVLVYAEKQVVQWYNAEAKEFWDLPIVNEDDDFELIEMTE